MTKHEIERHGARISAALALLDAGWELRRIALALGMEKSLAEAERIWVQSGRKLPA